MKILKKPIVKISVSLLLFVYIFTRQVKLSELVSSLKDFNPWYIPLILFLLIANYVISSFRWKSLLIFAKTEHIKVRYLTGLYFVGAFFNNFMPTSIGGDVYKALKLGSKIDSKTNAITATFMERFTGVIALVLISYVGLLANIKYWINLLPSGIRNNSVLVTLLEISVFLSFWIGHVFAYFALKFLAKKSKKIKGLYDALMLYKDNKRVLIYAFVTSIVVQLLSIFTQYFIFSAINVDLRISDALFIFPIITLASFFIPSINGLGVQDTLYNYLFIQVGIARELAVAASIIYHMFRLFVSLIGGLIYAIGKDF